MQVPCSGATYSSNSPATLTVKLADVGTAYRADVRVESKSGQGSFKLDRVELLNSDVGGDPFFFPWKNVVSVDSNAYIDRKVGLMAHTLLCLSCTMRLCGNPTEAPPWRTHGTRTDMKTALLISLPLIWPGSLAPTSRCLPQDMMTHSATILTSPNGDDFDGHAFFTLVCDNGETDEVQLLQYDGAPPTFTAGSTISLNLRTYDMGKVQTIKVSNFWI